MPETPVYIKNWQSKGREENAVPGVAPAAQIENSAADLSLLVCHDMAGKKEDS